MDKNDESYLKNTIDNSETLLSINSTNLSSISKIYYILIIKKNLDELYELDLTYGLFINSYIVRIEKLHEEFEKYYDWEGDFYFTDYEEKIQKSFLTYINEPINNYYSYDDIKIKCFILNDFINLYNFSKFKKINEKSNLINVNKIISNYCNWTKMLK